LEDRLTCCIRHAEGDRGGAFACQFLGFVADNYIGIRVTKKLATCYARRYYAAEDRDGDASLFRARVTDGVEQDLDRRGLKLPKLVLDALFKQPTPLVEGCLEYWVIEAPSGHSDPMNSELIGDLLVSLPAQE